MYDVYRPREEGYDEWAEDILLMEFCKFIKEKTGETVSSEHRLAIRDMIYGFFTAPKGEVTVIPAMMGLGKTTLLRLFVKFMTLRDKNFGCVIVKERIEDMDILQEQLDYHQANETPTAYVWKGFNEGICLKKYSEYVPGLCSRCDCLDCIVKIAPEQQRSHPVLIMTHHRLFRMTNSDKTLSRISKWEDSYGDVLDRPYIIIDERPNFFSTECHHWGEFERFIGNLAIITSRSGIDIDIDYIREKGNELFYSIPDKQAKSFNQDVVLKMFRKIEKYWWKFYFEKDAELFPFFLDFFTNGGYRNGEWLTTYQYTDYRFKDYKTIILDGTAQGDVTYPKECIFHEVIDFRKYNLTIKHCDQYNLSKTRLEENTEQIFNEIVPSIEEISKTGKTLVVVHKKYKDKIKHLLSGVQNIEIGHFNALKGTNKYNDCVNIFFAGTMYFGDDYYILKTLAIEPNKITSFDTETYDSRRTFVCGEIERIKIDTNMRYLLQDLFRISIRNVNKKSGNTPNTIYLFSTDNHFVDSLKVVLPGCIVEEWVPVELLRRKAPNQYKLLTNIDKMLVHSGDSISKKELQKLVGMNDSKEFRRLLHHPFIVKELKKRNLTGWEANNRARSIKKIY